MIFMSKLPPLVLGVALIVSSPLAAMNQENQNTGQNKIIVVELMNQLVLVTKSMDDACVTYAQSEIDKYGYDSTNAEHIQLVTKGAERAAHQFMREFRQVISQLPVEVSTYIGKEMRTLREQLLVNRIPKVGAEIDNPFKNTGDVFSAIQALSEATDDLLKQISQGVALVSVYAEKMNEINRCSFVAAQRAAASYGEASTNQYHIIAVREASNDATVELVYELSDILECMNSHLRGQIDLGLGALKQEIYTNYSFNTVGKQLEAIKQYSEKAYGKVLMIGIQFCRS